ncbi:phage tail sheath family protein [Microseira wollei]|uniref:Tail sheath protein n=1 Tax=Microseira wollei NIES-4236 TaxID=2530354 RepID=A0AAV3XGH6_9CYAN|nr:phage tail sheath subtilisin-like domain-containing protein [Microseira wollei]GET39205.1 tail sheath protein [Microseira wollei NIES-4236]
MPITPTYPGVYIEEIPSGVRTITGVSTSVTAFVGYTQRGSTDKGVQIFNFGDYERQFGGLDRDSPISYAVQQFFLNGGAEAWVVRVAKGAAKAAINLKNNVDGGAVVVLTVTAISEGTWGNLLRVEVNYDTANPASLFNLSVTELVDRGGTLEPGRREIHRNLSLNSFSPSYGVNVINAGSELIEVSRPGGATAAIANAKATSTSGVLTLADLAQLNDDHRRLAISLDGDGAYEFDIFDAGGGLSGATLNDRLDNLASRIQSQVRAIKPAVPAFSGFTCVRNSSQIVATSGTPNGEGEKSAVRFSNASIRNATAILKLGVSNGGREVEATALIRPVQSGTTSTDLSGLDLTTLAQPASLNVTLQVAGVADDGPYTINLWNTRPTTLEELRSRLTSALASSSKVELNRASVSLVDSRLRVVAGGSNPNVRLHFTNAGGDTTATNIGLVGGIENVAQYAVGVGLTSQAESGAVPGDDGTPPDPNNFKGSRANKKGLYALEDVDIFNILCLPNISDAAVLSEALSYVTERRAFLLIDFPPEVDTVVEAKQWLATNATLRSKNAAIYFPRIQAADPLQGNRIGPFPTCGAIAGLYARIDATRGVWKAPAGTEAVLRGVQKLDYTLTDPENGTLNPLAINCLRTFPAYGSVVWGGRTLEGTDVLASEWKYIPVRRLALFIEESLYRGTKWVVFEPNDEPLWSQIRLNIGAFMNNLFRQGAFQGKTPREAYFVKCDRETTTQNDINLGIVNILVGFAPLKPAEFVIIKIQQMAGQIVT